MTSFTLLFWHWLILGTVLLALETVAPAMLLMWFGIGALLTGGILWLFPELSLGAQIALFALSSLSSIFAWRISRFREENISSDTPELNNRLRGYIGQTFVLTEAIVDGRGSIRVGDTAWRVKGQNLPAGTRVRITGVNGILFEVVPTDEARF